VATLERRYGLTSVMSGLISTTYDLSSLFGSLIAAHFASRRVARSGARGIWL
jgi:hypothetical protein